MKNVHPNLNPKSSESCLIKSCTVQQKHNVRVMSFKNAIVSLQKHPMGWLKICLRQIKVLPTLLRGRKAFKVNEETEFDTRSEDGKLMVRQTIPFASSLTVAKLAPFFKFYSKSSRHHIPFTCLTPRPISTGVKIWTLKFHKSKNF